MHPHLRIAARSRLRRPLRFETLEPRCLLAGVTLWAHGFNDTVDRWITAQADAIVTREDSTFDQSRYRITVTDPGHDGGPLEVVNTDSSGSAPGALSTLDPEIVLMLDWSDVAGTLTPGGGYHRSTAAVAAAVAQRLTDPDLLSDLDSPVSALPLHLIGHSRGASLVGELAHQLGLQGVWVDQVTTLDPHPVDGVLEPLLANYDFGDAPMIAWQNVVFWDNYWRTDGAHSIDVTGEPVVDTADTQLSESVLANGGYLNEHLDVPLWYHGTIDTSTDPPANDGWVDVPNAWYDDPHPARDSAGFAYSRIIGGQRSGDGLLQELGGEAVRAEVDWSSATWPNLLAVSIARDDIRTVPGGEFPVQFDYQDADSAADVTFLLEDDHNPLNGTGVVLETVEVATTSEAAREQLQLTVPEVAAGVYPLLARIDDDAGRTRYSYARRSIIVNRSPTLTVPGNLEIDEDADLQTIGITDISAGGSERQPLRVTATSSTPDVIQHPAVTHVSPEEAASLSFAPHPNATGAVTITLAVEDGGPDLDLDTEADNASSTYQFTIVVNPINDVPESYPDTFTGWENQQLTVAPSGVLSNDRDIDEDPLRTELMEPTRYGQLTLTDDGGFNYLPDPHFNRVDHFQYRSHDAVSASEVTSATIHLQTAFPWYNGILPLDTNDDGVMAPNDAITGIAHLNQAGPGPLPSDREDGVTAPFFDVNRDGHHSAVDVLLIVNALNSRAAAGEGEANLAPPPLWTPCAETVPATVSMPVGASPAPGCNRRPTADPRPGIRPRWYRPIKLNPLVDDVTLVASTFRIRSDNLAAVELALPTDPLLGPPFSTR